MRHRSLLISIVALLALAVSAPAALAASPRAVVYSKATTVEGVAKGGLFAVKAGRLNQLTEDPTDTEPAFSPDGRTIAFVRGGDLYSVRPDGSGQRRLTTRLTSLLMAARSSSSATATPLSPRRRTSTRSARRGLGSLA